MPRAFEPSRAGMATDLLPTAPGWHMEDPVVVQAQSMEGEVSGKAQEQAREQSGIHGAPTGNGHLRVVTALNPHNNPNTIPANKTRTQRQPGVVMYAQSPSTLGG